MISDGSTANRGCMSDTEDSGRNMCIENDAQCSKCAKRACNSQSVEFENPISCIKCSSDNDTNCSIVHENTTAVECARTTIGYGNVCFIHKHDNVITRGCLYEASNRIFEDCKMSLNSVCSTCNQSDCNRTPVNNTFKVVSMQFEKTIQKHQPEMIHQIDESNGYRDKPLKCFRCDGNEDCNLMHSSMKSQMEPQECPLSSEYDQCFTYIDNGK